MKSQRTNITGRHPKITKGKFYLHGLASAALVLALVHLAKADGGPNKCELSHNSFSAATTNSAGIPALKLKPTVKTGEKQVLIVAGGVGLLLLFRNRS